MKLILPRLHYFTGLLVGHVYCIEDPDGLTLVDAGLGLAAKRVLDQLHKWGRQPSEVKRILVTHAHPDHVGGLPALAKATGAKAICSSTQKPCTEGIAPVLRKGYKPGEPMAGTPVGRTVEDGEVIAEVMGGLQAIATPGHSLGQMAFWQPQQGVLICGDTMMNMIKLTLPFDAFTTDMRLARESVAKVAQLQPRVVCFGHGPTLMVNASQKISAFAKTVN